MNKDPAALFYIDTWLSSTAEMDADCRGWYLNLILHQYDKGDLPSDVERLAQLANVKFSEFQRFQQVWQQVLQQKFHQNDNGRLENSKVNEILRKREAFKEKRSIAGKISVISKVAYKMKYSDDEIESIKEYLKENPEHEIFKYSDNQQMIKQMLQQVLQLYINVNETVNGNINTDKNKKENNKKGEQQKPNKKIPPDYEQVKNYFAEKGDPEPANEAQKFYDFYQSKGWVVGKSRMKDWQSAVRNWLSRKKEQTNGQQKNKEPTWKEPTWQEREQTARQVADNLNKLDEYEREHGLNEGF